MKADYKAGSLSFRSQLVNVGENFSGHLIPKVALSSPSKSLPFAILFHLVLFSIWNACVDLTASTPDTSFDCKRQRRRHLGCLSITVTPAPMTVPIHSGSSANTWGADDGWMDEWKRWCQTLHGYFPQWQSLKTQQKCTHSPLPPELNLQSVQVTPL